MTPKPNLAENRQITPFTFQNRSTRTFEKDGELCIIAKDMAEALEYAESSISNIGDLIQHVPEEWKGRERFPTPGGIQEMLYLTEPGLYFFLARSDKPLALPFQKWIAGEVIPSIRKKGFYAAPGNDRQEQDEWKKNFPYPFLLLEDAAVKMREMRLAMNKGAISISEWRRVVLGDFGSHKPCTDVIDFANENLTITGSLFDYVRISDLYDRYQLQGEGNLTRFKFTRQIKAAFPTLVYKQKKIDNYPVLVFCGCKLKNTLKEAVNG